jgi:anthranilate phosphoribosyltransferase
LVAEALARLGSERAAVVHGAGGLDEVSTLGPSEAAWVEGGRVEARAIEPIGVGARAGAGGAVSIEALQARDLEDGVRIVRAVLGSGGVRRSRKSGRSVTSWC